MLRQKRFWLDPGKKEQLDNFFANRISNGVILFSDLSHRNPYPLDILCPPHRHLLDVSIIVALNDAVGHE